MEIENMRIIYEVTGVNGDRFSFSKLGEDHFEIIYEPTDRMDGTCALSSDDMNELSDAIREVLNDHD